MSELTVSMPAHNVARHIGDAIRSVLSQQGLDFELVVVDDGSTDNTASVVASFDDARLRLIRNERSMGLAHCHNQVVEHSRSSFIAQVGPADVVLPEAFVKIVTALKRSAEIGLAHGYSFEIDAQGRITKDAFRARRSALIKNRTPGMDYKKALLFSEQPIDRFKVYRREALLAVGGFDETLTNGADFDLALRLVDRFAITLVPEFLYCYRSRTRNGRRRVWSETLTRWHRYSLCRRRLKDSQTLFLSEGHYNPHKLFFAGLIEARKPKISATKLKALLSNSLSRFSRTFPFSLAAKVYAALITRLARRLPSYVLERQSNISGRKIAYYAGDLPVQSWLAIEQELTELKNSALAVELIFDGPEPPTAAEVGTVSFFERQQCYKSGEGLGWAYRKRFFLKNPVRCLNLLFFAMTRKHGRHKRLSDDLSVFAKAVDLALVLEERKIDHIHAPYWGHWAFIAFIAARLRGATYSMQAQGSEMKSSLLLELVQELGAREFLIVNGPYKPDIAMGALSSQEDRIVMIDGLELKRLQSRRYGNDGLEMRILSIAGPVEQSGLIHLVEALHILKNENSPCHCEISTAPADYRYTDHSIQLRKLQRRLELEDSLLFSQARSSQELRDKLHAADVFVLPGAIEDSAIDEISPTLFVAMTLGMAVICANVHAVDGLVEDGITGILVPPGDARALAIAIARLKTNPELRKRLGETARKFAREQFDVKRPAETRLRLFRRVIGQTETGSTAQTAGVAKL